MLPLRNSVQVWLGTVLVPTWTVHVVYLKETQNGILFEDIGQKAFWIL
jgi:hypothetical protein